MRRRPGRAALADTIEIGCGERAEQRPATRAPGKGHALVGISDPLIVNRVRHVVRAGVNLQRSGGA